MRTGLRETPRGWQNTPQVAKVGANTVPRPERMREEAVFLGPIEKHVHGTVRVNPATGKTGIGREMEVSSIKLTSLHSPLQSFSGVFYKPHPSGS